MTEVEQRTVLTQEERQLLKRLFADSSEYPDELGTYIREFLRVNPPRLSVSSFIGGRSFKLVDKNTTPVAADSTTPTEIYRTTIKGGSIGTFGEIQLQVSGLVSCNDANNTVHVTVKLGGSTILQDIPLADHNTLDSTQRAWFVQARINAAGTMSSQFSTADFAHLTSSGVFSGNNAFGLSSVDLSQDKDLSVEVYWEGVGTQNFDKTYGSVISSRMAG